MIGRTVRLVAAAGLAVLVAACGDSPEKMVASAKDYLAKGDSAAAIIQLKNALQEAPDNGEARLQLGSASLQGRDFATAEKELLRALEMNQPAEAVLPLLARAMTELGHQEALVKDFGERKLGDPQATFQTMLGDASLRQNDRAEAGWAYATALEAKADYGAAQLGQATLLALDGNLDGALAAVDKIIAASPKLARAQGFRSDLLLAKGDRPGSRKALEAAIEADQAIETYYKVAALQPQSPQPLLRLAGLHVRQKDVNKAIDALKRAQKLTPNARDLVPQLAQVYVAANRPDDALTEARELQKSDPKFAGGYALEGDILLSQRKFAQAEKTYREALKLEPKAEAAAIRLHQAVAGAGKKSEARKELEALQAMPEDFPGKGDIPTLLESL